MLADDLEGAPTILWKRHLGHVQALALMKQVHLHGVVPGGDQLVAPALVVRRRLLGKLLPVYRPELALDPQPDEVLVPWLADILAARRHERRLRGVGQRGLASVVVRVVAAVDKPAVTPHGGLGAVDGSTLGGLTGVLRVQHLFLAAIQYDLESLPPVLAEGHLEGEDAIPDGALRLHCLRLPPVPGAHDVVAPLGQRFLLEVAPALGPVQDLALLRLHRTLLVPRRRLALVGGELAPEDDVAVRASHAAIRDALVGALQAELQQLGVDQRWPRAQVQVHVRVQEPQVHVGVHQPELRRDDQLHHAGHAAGLELVARVGLGGLEDEGGRHLDVVHALGSAGLHRGCRLDGLVEDRAVRIDIDGVHVQGRDVRHADRLVEDLLEGCAIRRRHVGALPGLVGGAGCQDAEEGLLVVDDHVAVNDVREGLEHHRVHAVAPDVAAGGRVEAEGAAHRGEHSPRAAEDEGPRAQLQVPGADQREGDWVPIPRPRQVRAGKVDGHQRRRALHIDGDAWTFHTHGEREAPTGNTTSASTYSAACDLLWSITPLSAGRVRDVDAPLGVHQLGDLVAVLDQGLVARLQRQPVARVHALRLRLGDAEERVVEQIDAIYEGPVLAVRLPLFVGLRLRVEEGLVAPALEGHLGDVVRARQEGGRPGDGVPGGHLSSGSRSHRDVLTHEARVVGQGLPMPRQRHSGLILGDALFVLPHQGLRPFLQGLAGGRDVRVDASLVLVLQPLLLVEGGEAVRLPHRREAVLQGVGPKEHQGPGLH
mmetsp:Transcript_103255/g.266947  ORF Transcript_103255/g.266947 Transcript_103255/m.266947 type:complete len:767 (-) Transcript_103255:666-2966(-)